MAKPVSAVPMPNSVGAAAGANAAAVPAKKKWLATNRKCADGNGSCDLSSALSIYSELSRNGENRMGSNIENGQN